ncbi:MAG: hypothetical protein V7L20_11175 [Nostoc sp.]|uniref:hypothetical protein n=1 Tax=Nostoc sp. TaxID=1180 RepID=UPI002FF9398B
MKLSWETIVKIFTVLAVLCYLVGILTVNDYLYSLGISDFSSLKPRFIYTGVLVLFSIFSNLTFSIIVFMYRFKYKVESIKDLKFERISLRFLWQILFSSLVGSLFFAVVYFVLFSFLFHFDPPEPSSIKTTIKDIFEVWFWGSIVCVCPGIILFFNTSIINSQARFSILLFLGFLFIIVFSYYLTSFGYYVYPLIPEQYGGGKPKEVKIFFKEDISKEIEKIGINTQVNTDTQKIKLLFEGDKNYILKIEETKKKTEIVQINKDDVRGIRFVRPFLLDK